jgi:5,10-methylenetetrahydromethanopterin reductase
MTTQTEAAPPASDLARVAEDMSAFIIAGAVASQQQDTEYDTVSRTPAQGIQDGVDAERLGFRRVWLSERIDLKWSDVILSGIAARTSRLESSTLLPTRSSPTAPRPCRTAHSSAPSATVRSDHEPAALSGLARVLDSRENSGGASLPLYPVHSQSSVTPMRPQISDRVRELSVQLP